MLNRFGAVEASLPGFPSSLTLCALPRSPENGSRRRVRCSSRLSLGHARRPISFYALPGKSLVREVVGRARGDRFGGEESRDPCTGVPFDGNALRAGDPSASSGRQQRAVRRLDRQLADRRDPNVDESGPSRPPCKATRRALTVALVNPGGPGPDQRGDSPRRDRAFVLAVVPLAQIVVDPLERAGPRGKASTSQCPARWLPQDVGLQQSAGHWSDRCGGPVRDHSVSP